jgi:3-phenylpropionate/trans-cinnamate dioxygenase ferredoxin reductase subunit
VRDIVIVGAGQAGQEAAAALRSGGYDGRLTLVGDETHMPYQRPPLSKAYLHAGMAEADLYLETSGTLGAKTIRFISDDRAIGIDRPGRQVLLGSGIALPYDHLILATGARARPLPGNIANIAALRSLHDANGLRQSLDGARRAVVIGAGFIGLEFAATASALGIAVDIVEREDHILARVSTPPVARAVQRHHEARGVRFHLGRNIAALDSGKVELDDGTQLGGDIVLGAIGVLPNSELAAACGLTTDNGIVVDNLLLTDDHAISAIGDCASFAMPGWDRPVRLESVQNAADHGVYVAGRLLGNKAPYSQLPLFWTDQSGLRLQIAGLGRPDDELVLRGDPDGAFSVFHLRGGRLVSVESVNRPADHMGARALLKAGITPSSAQIVDIGANLREIASASVAA